MTESKDEVLLTGESARQAILDEEVKKIPAEDPVANAAQLLESLEDKSAPLTDEPINDTEEDGKPQLQDQTNLLPAREVIIVFIGLSLGVFLAFLESTILGTALFSITKDLHGGEEAPWIITSYLLVSTALTPIYGRISDIFGRKMILLACLIEFWFACLACALAQSTTQLILFRSAQAVGGGAVISLVLIIISDIVTLRDRGKYQGILEVVITVASGIGPVLGGVFADTNWRWCFWMNLPLGAITILVTWKLLPLRKVVGNYKQKLLQIDYMGSALVLVASVLFLLGLNWGGVRYNWVSAPVLVTLVLGGVCYGVFMLWEAKFAKLPIVPVSVFRSRTAIGVYLITASNGCFHYGMLFYIPQFLQVVFGYSALRAGVLTLPYLCCVAPSVFLCGQLISLTGRYRPQIYIGSPGMVVGCALLYTLNENSSLGKLVGIEVLLALSAGCTFQTSLVALQTAMKRSDMAVSTSVRNFIRLLAGTIWLAVASALIQNSLANVTLSDDVRKEVRNDPAGVRRLTNIDQETIQTIVNAYTSGFRTVFLVMSVLSAIGCIGAWTLIKHHDLSRPDDAKAKEDSKLWLEERKARKQAKKDGTVAEGESPV